MKNVVLSFLVSYGVGTMAYAQSAFQSVDAVDEATNSNAVMTPVNPSNYDFKNSLYVDDGVHPFDVMFVAPGPGGGGHGGGFGGGGHPGGGGGMPSHGGGGPIGGGHPGGGPIGGNLPGYPGHGGPVANPGHGGGNQPHPGPIGGNQPNYPGHGGPVMTPGHPGHAGGNPGNHWGPGHNGGSGHGWHPGTGGFFHDPRWNPGYHWDHNFHPHWWYAGSIFPMFFWEADVPGSFWQCIAFDQEGENATPYLGYAPNENEAAFNALEACGGEQECYIPSGYCQVR